MTTPSFEVVRTSPPSRRVCVLILIWISIEYGKVAKCILSWVSNKGSSAVSLTLPTAVDQILDISLLMHDFNATLTTKTNNQIAKCIWHQKFNRLCQGSNLYLWTVEPGMGGSLVRFPNCQKQVGWGTWLGGHSNPSIKYILLLVFLLLC